MKINQTERRHDAWMGLLAFSLIALLVCLIVAQHRPPQALPADAPPSQFSAERALKDLRVIAERPHPIGSAEHAKVRDHIVQALSGLGLQPEVQRTTVVSRLWGSPYPAATVENILARVKGTEGKKAVLLAVHYDSAPNSPGASDDGSAVAGLIEVARALKTLPPLKNDLIFLFTDGEEPGLLGAIGFVKQHPWARDVGLALNFEARGSSGPVYMFETSANNELLIQEFATAAPRPFASSWMYDIYKILPNDTDATVFKIAGLPALNFANIEYLNHYHTRLDNIENADQRTLQHQGSTALALATNFGNFNLENTGQNDAVYFDILGLTMIVYSMGWIIPLAVLTLLLFAGVVILGRRRGRLTLRGIALGFLAFLLSVVIPCVLVTLIWRGVRASLDEYQWMPAAGSYTGLYFFLSFMALTAALVLVVMMFGCRRVSALNLAMGALLGWLLLSILSIVYLPGGSYLFTWPLLFSLVAVGVMLIPEGQEPITGRQFIVLSLCAIPGIVLWVPVIYMTYLAIGLSRTAVLVALAVILLGSIVPHLSLMTSRLKWLIPGALAMVSLGLLVAGSINSGFDEQHPKPNSIFYGLNADKNESRWISADAKVDEWTSQFFPGDVQPAAAPEFFPLSDAEFFQSPAPVAAVPAPHVALLEDSTANNVRTLRVRITSPRRAPLVAVSIDNDILGAAINGQPFDDYKDSSAAPPKGLAFRYFALGEDGIELALEVKPLERIGIRLIDISYGLPDIQGISFKARPEYMMPTANRAFAQNTTMVSKSYTF